jgi:alpha-tubulin suppressor-like RCC1 family protein
LAWEIPVQLMHLPGYSIYQSKPDIVDIFAQIFRIQQVSLSYKHAAALDSIKAYYNGENLCFIDNGEIYTWGTGNFGELCHSNTTYLNQPAVFRSHELLSCKNVVCHKNLTAVVTSNNNFLA